jgi:DNA-directed RNA polymerase subunit M/transcription elongation factor TFIIS
MPFETAWARDDSKCPHCGEEAVWWRRWISMDEAHEDINYICEACNRIWWVDGCDY